MTAAYPADPSDPAYRQEAEETSIGQLISDISADLSRLFRQEVELAKAEVRQEVTQTGKASGMLGGAGFAGYMVLLFLSIAAWWGLATVMDEGWAALIVAAIWAVIGAVLYVTGRNTFRTVHPTPERTLQTVKQVPGALKGSKET